MQRLKIEFKSLGLKAEMKREHSACRKEQEAAERGEE